MVRTSGEVIEGDNGSDGIDGTERSDILRGRGGNDDLDGEEANDRLEGGTGNDSLRGEEGTDFLTGGAGSDELAGGDGADRVWGDDGNDELDGGAGMDSIFGGRGADLFILDDPETFDIIRDFSIAQGDEILLTISDVLIGGGDTVDGDLVRLVRSGNSLLLQADLDNGVAGDFRTIAQLVGVATAPLDSFLDNPIA
jgi:Ca2+-binding RTX toxin-like protein